MSKLIFHISKTCFFSFTIFLRLWLASFPIANFSKPAGSGADKIFERFTVLNVRKLLDDWRHATIVARWLRCFWRWRKISHAVRIRKSQIIARIHKKATQRCYPTQKMPPGECYSPNPTTLSEPHTQPLLIIVQCSIYLQIEHLSGRNEELRHELHNAREETAKSIMQLERKNAKVHGSFCNLWNKPVIINKPRICVFFCYM